MYAVVESGGKQYRVEEGTVLVVDRLKADQGEVVALKPVMFRNEKLVADAKSLEKVKIEATVTEHFRGDKIKVFKYKAKKGYSRRAGHRAELTRLEVTSFGGGAKKKAATKQAAAESGDKPKAESAGKPKSEAKAAGKPKAETKTAAKPKSEAKTAAKPKSEAGTASEKAPAKKPAAKAKTESKPPAKKPAEKKPAEQPAEQKEDTDGA